MKGMLLVLTFAIALGVVVAPAATASCPPTGGPSCSLFPLTHAIDCLSEGIGNTLDQILTDCI